MALDNTSEKNFKSERHLGRAAGILLVLLLVIPQAIWFSSGMRPSELEQGLYLMLLSGIFLGSYFYEEKVFLFKWIMWLFTHFHAPKSRLNAFAYFAVCLGIAIWRFVHAVNS